MKSKITLSNMQFYGYIGCFDEEKVIGTRFSVSIEMLCDIGNAAIEDDLNQTVNYQAVYTLVKKTMQERVNLLETMAERISQRIRTNFSNIEKMTVSISKLNPMLAAGGALDAVTVTIEN